MSDKEEVIIKMDKNSYLRFLMIVNAREKRKEAQNIKNHKINPNMKNTGRDSSIKWSILTPTQPQAIQTN